MATSISRPAPGAGAPSRTSARAFAGHRELLGELVRRDLKARYRGSALGVGWSLLNPLIYMVVYTVVFSKFMRFRIPDPHHPGQAFPYAVYLLSGLLAWNFFGNSVAGSVNSVLGNAALVKKVAFPWVLLTLSSVIAAFVNYLISLALLVPLLLYFKIVIGPSLVLVPLVAAITFTLALGLSLFIAAGNVYFRDIEHLVLISLQVMFFLTPIIYQLDDVLNRVAESRSLLAIPFKAVLFVNPMTWITTTFQDVIAFDRWPSHPAGLLYATSLSVVLLIGGLAFFNRLRRRFAEEL